MSFQTEMKQSRAKIEFEIKLACSFGFSNKKLNSNDFDIKKKECFKRSTRIQIRFCLGNRELQISNTTYIIHEVELNIKIKTK
jgi:hypothetical protein